MMSPRRLLLYLVLTALLVLHQDVWNWSTLSWTLGLPSGFLYHVTFCIVVAFIMWLLLRLDRSEETK
jgi:hypothetical protein